MTHDYLREQYTLWAALVMPANAGPVQRQEMRRAFYSGAEALFKVMFAASDHDKSDDDGVEMLGEVAAELRRFADEVKKGRA